VGLLGRSLLPPLLLSVFRFQHKGGGREGGVGEGGGGVASSKGGVRGERRRREGEEQSRAGSEHTHRLHLGQPPGPARLVGGGGVRLGLPVQLGLAAADLEGGGGGLPGLLRGAPAPLALAHQLLLLGAALLARVGSRAGNRPDPPPPRPGRLGTERGQGIARPFSGILHHVGRRLDSLIVVCGGWKTAGTIAGAG